MKRQAIVFLVYLVGGCMPAWALDQDAALKLAMNSAYGNYSGWVDAWLVTVDNINYKMKPATVKAISTPYGDRLYIFVSGSVVDERDGAHANSGLVGAHVVEERNGVLNVVASTKAIPSGSFGTAPDSADLKQFGPDHYYGWVVVDGYTGQGYKTEVSKILLPRGKRMDVLGRIPVLSSNVGAKPCDVKETRNECEDIRYEWKIDASSDSVKVWPLIVTQTGVKKGRKISPVVTPVLFDEKRWRYDVPKALSIGY